MPISIRDASRCAIEAVEELFDDQSISNVRFEEVERMGVDWLITVGFDRQVENPNYNFGGIVGLQPRTERKYKVAKINHEGDLVSIKDRLL
ncbi:hypothetical protein [Pseudomonas viridiflava]|uniref:hypothetical protein n=1 Tax=Pseudomonas viridiflava TaxID=33069 RepID=UPI000C07EF8E|nr:hypothetical protein [Pseudomonas viridiflava]PHN61968.1 hypothetical protein AO275_20780 [Pseudomonas viridiflava]